MLNAPSLAQWKIFGDIYYWRTALFIAKSNLAKQYRNSFLGIIWTLVQPLSMVVVYAIIIPLIAHFSTENYPLYIICTLPLWGLISNSLVSANYTLLAQAETLKRCMISTTVFPIAEMIRLSYTYFISFAVMYVVVMLMGYSVSWHVLLWPLYFIPVMLSITGICIGIAYAAPYVRDIAEAIVVGMNVMIWFSAVVYPITAVPEWVGRIMAWNPLYILLQPLIELVYYQRLPGLFIMVKLFGVMFISLAIGYTLYRVCRRNYVYYL